MQKLSTMQFCVVGGWAYHVTSSTTDGGATGKNLAYQSRALAW
jgi:hypothetical protein